MMIFIIVTISLCILAIGFGTTYKNVKSLVQRHEFAVEYRNTFVDFANQFNTTFERHWSKGTVDDLKFTWLTKNVIKIQRELGPMGKMDYVSRYRTYHAKNYEIIVNTLPMFRDGNVHEFDITSVDDCLVRYIGFMEELIEHAQKGLRNPFVWFRQGFQEIISLPLYVLNWFGLLPETSVSKVTTNIFYKLFVGISSLVAFLSAVVTIIQGQEETIIFFQKAYAILKAHFSG